MADNTINTIKHNDIEYPIEDTTSRNNIGDLSLLETSNKDNLVSAINEAANKANPTDEQIAAAVGGYLDEHPTTEYYSLGDKKKSPEYYGIDIDNDVRSDVTVPDDVNRLPKENLSIIIPNSTYYASTLKVIGDTTVSYITTHSTIVVDGVVYGIHRWELTDLPTNPNKWKLTIAINSVLATNSTTWFVEDMALEEITAKFIKSECTESVSATFLKAVSVARHVDAPVSEIYSLKGKVWLALGDSYTKNLAGAYTDGVTPATSGKWSELANQLGMTLYSYGIASSTIRYSTNNNSDGYSYQPMATRVDTLIADYEGEVDSVGLITFMGGLNDSESFLGDSKSVENTTIYGACHQIFNKLLIAFPKAKIVVILQPVSGNGAPPADSEFSGMSNAQYSIYNAQLKQRAVKEVAEFYGLTICDCCFDWYTTANPTHLSTIWNSDLIHLSNLGNRRLTEKLAKTLEGILL